MVRLTAPFSSERFSDMSGVYGMTDSLSSYRHDVGSTYSGAPGVPTVPLCSVYGTCGSCRASVICSVIGSPMNVILTSFCHVCLLSSLYWSHHCFITLWAVVWNSNPFGLVSVPVLSCTAV